MARPRKESSETLETQTTVSHDETVTKTPVCATFLSVDKNAYGKWTLFELKVDVANKLVTDVTERVLDDRGECVEQFKIRAANLFMS